MSRNFSEFRFKQFTVQHDRSTMKVGTDAVLLGAWTDPGDASRVLDIGAGSGVISLMLAQRTDRHVTIDALEPDHESYLQAMENVARSPWPDKVIVHSGRLQNFTSPSGYDLIVSNPPYFVNSQPPPVIRRSKARHTGSLDHDELITNSIRLLNDRGRIAVILPTEEGLQFQSLAALHHLYVNRQLEFYSRAGKPQERWLLEFSFSRKEVKQEALVLHGQGEEWSEAYKQLTREFYLKL